MYEELKAIHMKYQKEPGVTAISEGQRVGTISFAVLPSGSKEGWEEAEIHEGLIRAIIDEVREHEYEDGGRGLDYIYASKTEDGILGVKP